MNKKETKQVECCPKKILGGRYDCVYIAGHSGDCEEWIPLSLNGYPIDKE